MKTFATFILLFITVNLYSQNEPAWINNYPSDDLYYTGIGSSNSGNKARDYERALIQARLNLASEISTSISAETQIITTDNNSGMVSESFTEKLNQSVEQNLKELEIVDTYYSGNQGYWIYIRLNKNRWQEIQREEMSILLGRIQLILDDDYFSNRASTADKLFKLASASVLLDLSPYRGILTGELGSLYEGNIFDFLQSEIFKNSSGISIEIENSHFSLISGNSVQMRLDCKSSDYYTGKLPIIILKEEEIILESYSDVNGILTIEINSSLLDKGSNNLLIKIDPGKIGFSQDSSVLKSFIPGIKEISISLQSPSLFLSINSNRENLDFIMEPVSSLFTKGNEDFQLTDDRNSSTYKLIFSTIFTDYPRVLENAPLMAGLNCSISLKRDDRILYEFQYPTLKDGGLTYEQAYRRVLEKLIRALEQDRSYIQDIESAMTK